MAGKSEEPLAFGMRPAEHRVERFCDACGQVDSDPHHHAGHSDGNWTDRHIDCCAAAGCPDKSCDGVEASTGGKRGAALVKHLTGGGVDHLNYAAQEK